LWARTPERSSEHDQPVEIMRVIDGPPDQPPSAEPPGLPAPQPEDREMRGPPDQYLLTGDRPLHLDDLFDGLLVRLRAELLDERERQGRLIGDGRW
jgi:hypothetical protein